MFPAFVPGGPELLLRLSNFLLVGVPLLAVVAAGAVLLARRSGTDEPSPERVAELEREVERLESKVERLERDLEGETKTE